MLAAAREGGSPGSADRTGQICHSRMCVCYLPKGCKGPSTINYMAGQQRQQGPDKKLIPLDHGYCWQSPCALHLYTSLPGSYKEYITAQRTSRASIQADACSRHSRHVYKRTLQPSARRWMDHISYWRVTFPNIKHTGEKDTGQTKQCYAKIVRANPRNSRLTGLPMQVLQNRDEQKRRIKSVSNSSAVIRGKPSEGVSNDGSPHT